MKRLTVTALSRNFCGIINELESEREEIVITRDHRPIARLVPEPLAQNALEVLGDLHCTLDADTADALLEGVDIARKANRGMLTELRIRRQFEASV